MKKHLFIVGAGRSGTTYLWRILNNSQQIHLSTEIHYFSKLYHNGFLKNLSKRKLKAINLNKLNLSDFLNDTKHFGMYWIKNEGFSKKEVIKYFNNKKINRRNIYDYLFLHDMNQNNKENSSVIYIGEKTPLNIFHTGQILDWFPESTIIHIFRTPIEVLKSEGNKPNKPDYFLTNKNYFYQFGIIVFVYFEWLFSSFIALFKYYNCPENFVIINYEKLVENTENSIFRLFQKLKLEYNSELISVKKIGSSYQNKKNKKYWKPNKFAKTLFCTLNPIYNRLIKISINH